MAEVMRDHEVILSLLGRVARRLWADRALQEIGFGLSLVLFSLLAYRLVQPALGATPGGTVAAAGFSVVLGAGLACVLRRAARRTTLAQAAAAVDARARLKDEVKTAYWLCAQGEASPFAQLQIARAARTVARLDARRLAPARAPRSWWTAGLLAVALSGTGFVVAPVSHSWETDAAEESGTGTAGDLRALLEEAPRDAATEKLERALAALEARDAPLRERQRALAQAREAQDEINLRAVAAREAMSELASAMATREELQSAARALREGRAAEALELLHRMAGEERAAGADGEEQSAQTLREDGEFEASTERASRELRSRNLKLSEDTLNRVLRNIQDAQAVLETQNRVNEVRRRMENFLVAGSQRSPLTAGQFDRRAATPNPTPAPETGSADLQGGTVFRQGAVARDDRQDEAREGSITGAAEGHAEALAVEGDKTGRLEAKLKLETVQAGAEASGEVPAPTTWHYAATQSATAQTAFAEVRGRAQFSRAGVIGAESVPLRQRRLVKEYFINLHESEQ